MSIPTTAAALAAHALLSLAPAVAASARQPPDSAAVVAAAAAALREHESHCRAEGGRLWGVSLCGPVVLVEPGTRLAVTNAPDPGGAFRPRDGAWVGTLPPDVGIANTAVAWGSRRWTMVTLPLPADRFNRVRLVAHESFHRVQESLGIPLPAVAAAHLEEEDARVWLRLELRALVAAIERGGAAGRASAADAMLFRAWRHARFPGADTVEAALELGEGLAEYTGVRVAMAATGETPAGAARWVAARFERAPTWVRSLGYGTGPPLGLALDAWAPGWRARMVAAAGSGRGAGRGPAAALAAAVGAPRGVPAESAVVRRAAAYGHDAVAAEERTRAAERRARLADYRRRLVDGPVLVLRQTWIGGSFNPNTMVTLGELGTVYPSRTMESEWGRLTVREGGALVSPDRALLRVPAPAAELAPDARRVEGPGWVLELAPGWTVRPGARPGDLEVVKSS